MDKLLDFLASNPATSAAGISKATGIGAGRLYPRLAELERDGRIIGQWEWPEPRPDGTPRRRLYWIADMKTPAQISPGGRG